MSGEPMNRRDRDQLAQVAKMRARVAKAVAELEAVHDEQRQQRKQLGAGW